MKYIQCFTGFWTMISRQAIRNILKNSSIEYIIINDLNEKLKKRREPWYSASRCFVHVAIRFPRSAFPAGAPSKAGAEEEAVPLPAVRLRPEADRLR